MTCLDPFQNVPPTPTHNHHIKLAWPVEVCITQRCTLQGCFSLAWTKGRVPSKTQIRSSNNKCLPQSITCRTMATEHKENGLSSHTTSPPRQPTAYCCLGGPGMSGTFASSIPPWIFPHWVKVLFIHYFLFFDWPFATLWGHRAPNETPYVRGGTGGRYCCVCLSGYQVISSLQEISQQFLSVGIQERRGMTMGRECMKWWT